MMMDRNSSLLDQNTTDSINSLKLLFIGLEAFGLIGNSISIVVFVTILYDVNHNKRINPIANIPKFKFYWYLIFMAIEDTLISSLFVLNFIYDFGVVFSRLPCFIDIYFDCLNHFEVFMNLIVSMDRFSSILIPIEHKLGNFVTQKYPKLIGLLALILSISINIIPLVLEYPTYNKETNICSRPDNSPAIRFIKIQFVGLIVLLLFALGLNIFGWCFQCFYNWSRLRKGRLPSSASNSANTNNMNINNDEVTNNNDEEANSPTLLMRTTSGGSFLAFNRVRTSGAPLRRAKYSFTVVMITLNTIDLFFFATYVLYIFQIVKNDEETKFFITSIFFMLNHSVNFIIYFFCDSQFRLTCFGIFSKVRDKISRLINRHQREHQSRRREFEIEMTYRISARYSSNVQINKRSRTSVV